MTNRQQRIAELSQRGEELFAIWSTQRHGVVVDVAAIAAEARPLVDELEKLVDFECASRKYGGESM